MRNERGSALVVALFVIVLLTGMGTGLLFLSQQEARMGQASLRVKKAFYLAEAGLEDGRMTLWSANDDLDFDDDLDLAAGPDDNIDFDPATVRAVYDDNGNVTGFTGYGDDVPLRSMINFGTGEDPGWYASFLTNDPLEARNTIDDENGRIMLTGVGAARGRSLEIVEAVVEPLNLVPAVPPAAITMLGESPNFDNGSSFAQDHDGADCGVPGGAYAPIVGAVSEEARSHIQDAADRLDEDHFESGSFTGADTIADLTDPSDPIIDASGNGTIDPVWLDCLALKERVETMAAMAGYYCDSDSELCAIPVPNPPVVFIDGDLLETPEGNFEGLLVVTGELTYDGNTGWDGIILVIGEGRIRRNGGGGANPSGSLIIANIDPSPDGPNADKSDWCDSGFQQATYSTGGAGNSTVEWCTTSIDATNPIETYKVLEFVQR